MAGSTTTTLDDLLPQIVAEAMFQANEVSIMRGLVKNYNIGAGQGKTVTVPFYPSQTAATLVEGNEVANSVISTTGKTLTVETVAIRTLLTDLVRNSAGSNVVADIGMLFGEAIGRKIDQELLALFGSFAATVGDATTAMTAATVAQAVAKLRAANISGADISCIVHPNVAYDLKANLTNTFANPAAGIIQNRAMESGYVGMLFGVPVFESGNIVDTDGDSTGAVFHRNAIGLAMMGDIKIETARRASYVGDDLVASANFGVGILQNSHGVGVLADSSIVDA